MKDRSAPSKRAFQGTHALECYPFSSITQARNLVVSPDFLEKFQKMIDEYNAGSLNLEEFFKRLVTLARELNEEAKRGIAENLSAEELAIFDLLTKPEIKLTKKDEQQVMRVARSLLQTLKKEKLVLDWRKRQQTRAAVRVCIEETLEQLPGAYSSELYREKCERTYQHVDDSYFGLGAGVYGPQMQATG